MISAKRNYETYNAELLAIIKGFQTCQHNLKRAALTIFLLINNNNLKKFIEKTCLCVCQIL